MKTLLLIIAIAALSSCAAPQIRDSSKKEEVGYYKDSSGRERKYYIKRDGMWLSPYGWEKR